MSRKTRNPPPPRPRAARRRASRRTHAPAFAALGDPTRLFLVTHLATGHPRSISQLTRAHRLTRQAITKHLQVLESAGLVHSLRAGRQKLFALDPKPFRQLRNYLDDVSRQCDDALARLKSFVEKTEP